MGCPTGGSAQTLIRETYTLNNNSRIKFANWAAYKITEANQASATLTVDRGHQASLAGLDVEILSGYWKIIFIVSGPKKGEYAAFLLDQATPKSASFCDYR